jgi:23S rRNA pseudouridine2605 synthase
MASERLQKLLARAGIGSRRACEEVVLAGRVTVDGQAVSELGAKADPEKQDVRLDGVRLRLERPEYWLFNKPQDVVCTNYDPAGRRRPIDFMRQSQARLFPVGRLDADSRGALLMTNDGDFANRLTHPRYEVPKTYLATVIGEVTKDDVRRLMRGIYLAEGRTRPSMVQLVKRDRTRSLVEITIREGRNRQVRRMLARLGHNVRELVRTRIGRVTLRGLGVGHARLLSPEEVKDLLKLSETVAAPPSAGAVPEQGGRHRRPGRKPFKGRPGRRSSEGRIERKPRDERAGGRPFEGRPSGERREGRPDRGSFKGRPNRGSSEGRIERKPRDERAGGRPFEGPSGSKRREGRPQGKPVKGRREGWQNRGPQERSRPQHDTDGAGKTGPGNRRDASRGRSGRPGRRDGPPPRGRRPGGHSPQ